MNKILTALAVVSVVSLAEAYESTYWRGNSGVWSEGTNWSKGCEPNADSFVWLDPSQYSPSGNRPSTITLDKDVYLYRLYAQGNNPAATGVDPNPVTIQGPANLYLSVSAYHQFHADRDITFDHVDVILTNHQQIAVGGSGFFAYGDVTFKGGSLTAMQNGKGLEVGNSGSFTLTDGARARVCYLTHNPMSGFYILDGTFIHDGGLNKNDVITPNFYVGNGSFIGAPDLRLWTKGAIPSHSNAYISVNFPNYNIVQPPLSAGEILPWRGTLVVTNCVSSGDTPPQCTFTNTASFYGRGIFRGCRIYGNAGKTLDFDLRRVDIGYQTEGATFNFYDTTFGAFSGRQGGVSTDSGFNSLTRLFGATTIDLTNMSYPDDPSKRMSFASSTRTLCPQERASIHFKGNGTAVLQCRDWPKRLRAYTLGANASVTQKDANSSLSTPARTLDFALGANAVYESKQHNMTVEALGSVTIDPTATLVQTVYTSPGNACWPVFCSVEDIPQKPNVTISNGLPSGCTLRWVGGCAFFANDTDITSSFAQSYGYWLDAGPDCNFSTKANWGNGKLYKDGTVDMTLSGKLHTVMTNDVDNVLVQRLYLGRECDGYSATAPVIVRGKPIKITYAGTTPTWSSGRLNGGMGIITKSEFPHVLECRIDSDQDGLGVAVTSSERRGGIYFKGGINAPNARFVPLGQLVLGDAVTVRELCASNATGNFSRSYQGGNIFGHWTELLLKPGCRMTVSNQEIPNTAELSLVLMTNATMAVNGAWTMNVADTDHMIDGTLDLNATVGGDAKQGYFGKGVLKVKTTDGTAGGTMTVGEGLTLVPTTSDWGTMPLTVQDDVVISNDVDWTYSAGEIAVVRPGHGITFKGAGDVVLGSSLRGHDIVVRKEGAGTLTLTTAMGLTNSTVEVAAGALACTVAQTFGALRLAAGAALLVDFAGETSAAIDVGGDVSVEGVEFRSAGGESGSWKDVLRVPAGAAITGTPAADERLRFRCVTALDGTTTLQTKIRKGLTLIVR